MTAPIDQTVISIELPTAAETDRLGMALAKALPADPQAALMVELHGDLGMGKTALVRSLLRGLGVTGAVRSPTYTLCEPYEAAGWDIMHMDLYRLSDPEELEFLGVRELDRAGGLLLVEWPSQGGGELPATALTVQITDRMPAEGRRVALQAASADAERWLQVLVAQGLMADYM